MSRNFNSQPTNVGRFTAWVRSYSGKISIPDDGSAPISRASSDVRAAWAKWHSDSLEPTLSEQKVIWYLVLERARVETLAAMELDGIRSNLTLEDSPSVDKLTPQFLYMLARKAFAGQLSATGAHRNKRGTFGEPFGLIGKLRRLFNWSGYEPPRYWVESQLLCARVYLYGQTQFQNEISNLIEALPNWGSAQEADSLSLAVVDPKSVSPFGSPDEVCEDGTVKESNHVRGSPENVAASNEIPYMIFSRHLDEVGCARNWLRPSDRQLIRLLDSPDRERIKQIARRLQRRLLSRASQAWEFDTSEGRLDPRRLGRLVTAVDDRRIFRRKVNLENDQACITFLVDISGSIRPERRVMAALVLDSLLHALEHCAISAEALAFTTRFFHPNPLVDSWRAQGSPRQPGRLNAVRHVVLKDRRQRWKSSRQSLALLLKDGFGHENIDGEALDWAARRLAIANEKRKVLVVISDGEPYDEATEAANGAGFLEDHLRSVIQTIESSNIQLSAIGFNSQIGRFYRHAILVSNIDQLPTLIFDRIGDLLSPLSAKTH